MKNRELHKQLFVFALKYKYQKSLSNNDYKNKNILLNIKQSILYFCIPITFNNPLKACISNNKFTLQSKHTRHKLSKYIS